MRFENKVVIITGGSKGIGAGCASVFCAEGGTVKILDVDRKNGEALAKSLTERGPGQVVFAECDVSIPEQLKQHIDETAEHFSRLDCIINNAGVHPPAQSIDEISTEELDAVLRVNFLSTFAGAKFALPHLRKTKGTIINMSSMTAVLGQPESSAYVASKAAQLGFTKALAVEVGHEGIRVNAILPSNVDTPLMREWANTLDDPESALQRISKLQVFGRMADPEEIGRACLFLATEDSSFITGQGIQVDGGASLDY